MTYRIYSALKAMVGARGQTKYQAVVPQAEPPSAQQRPAQRSVLGSKQHHRDEQGTGQRRRSTGHGSLNGKASYRLTAKAKWELRTTRHPTETTGLAWEIVEVVEKVSREMSRALGLDEREKKQNFAKFSLPFLYSSHGKNRTFHILHWA